MGGVKVEVWSSEDQQAAQRLAVICPADQRSLKTHQVKRSSGYTELD
jgi:hypothetical protein